MLACMTVPDIAWSESLPTSLYSTANPISHSHFRRLGRSPTEDFPTWLHRLNSHVHHVSGHCDAISGYRGPNDNGEFSLYGVQVDWVARCGLCSQRAFWLSEILRRHGTEAQLLGLDGHVIAIVQEPSGRHWVLDPDYGVGPFLVDIESADAMAQAASINYAFLSRNGNAALHDEIVAIYASTNNNRLHDSTPLRRIKYQQQRWLQRLTPTIHNIRRSARAKYHPLSPLSWEQRWLALPPGGISAKELLPIGRLSGQLSTVTKQAIATFEAAAIHTTLIAASIKYGSRGYHAATISLSPIDYVSVTASKASGYEKTVTILNWGYRPAFLQLVPGGDGSCRLAGYPQAPITILPDTTMVITYRRDCSVLVPPAAE